MFKFHKSDSLWYNLMIKISLIFACPCSLIENMWTLDNAWLLPPANEVWGKIIFVHLSVILFTGGVCPIACWDTPPGAESSPEQTLPQADTPPRTRGRHPPPGAVHAARCGQQAGGTHPTGMRSCIFAAFTKPVSILSTSHQDKQLSLHGSFGSHLFWTYFYKARGQAYHVTEQNIVGCSRL